MNVILSLLRRFRGLVVLTVVASMMSAGAGVALINEINALIAAPNALTPQRIGVMAGLLAMLFACGFGSQALLAALGHRVVYELRLMMVKRVVDTDVERLESIGAPNLYATLTKDIDSIGMAFNRVPFVLYNGMLVLGGFVYLAWLSWPLFALTVVLIVAGAAFAQVCLLRMRKLMRAVRDLDDRIYAGYQGAIEGRYELALNAWRKRVFYERDFEPAAEQARATEVRADRYWMLSMNWVAVLMLGLACAVFVAGQALGVAQGVVVAFVLVLMFLRTPLNELVGGASMLVAGNVALEKMESLRLEPHRTGFASAQPAALVPHGQELLSLEGVVYEYPHAGDEYGFRLGPVDLQVRRGELLFLVGGNGTGKSTLAKILTGLYRPAEGSVRLNGVPIGVPEIEWYRSHFSAVLSGFHLFERLVGPGGAFDPALAQAFLERLQMQGKVAIADERLSTTRLSQGQRKRLALLMAFVEERPILVLDEWAADQDPAFRAYFYFDLLPELKRAGKTVIAISHDDRYFGVADRVLKCDSGRVAPSARDTAARAVKHEPHALQP